MESLSKLQEMDCRERKKFGVKGEVESFFFFFTRRCFSMFVVNGYNPAKWEKLIMQPRVSLNITLLRFLYCTAWSVDQCV